MDDSNKASEALKESQMKIVCAIGLILIVSLCRSAPAAQYTIGGACEFKGFWETELKGDIHSFPVDTCVELMKDGDVVDQTLVTGAGTYSFTVNANETDQFQIRIRMDTMRDLAQDKERINMKGRFDVLLVPVNHQWRFDSSTFTLQEVDGNNHLNLDLFVGDDEDSDITPNGGSGIFREWDINDWFGYNETEDTMAKLAAVMLVMNQIHREVDASDKITGWGDWENQATHGQIVLYPGGVEANFTAALTSPIGSWDIHLAASGLNASTAAHEFGHIIHYHSTDWNVGDLAAELLGGHTPPKETNQNVAYAEAWGEFVEYVFADTNCGLVTYSPGWITGAWGGDFWKGTDVDGTNNSGEIVEGAVAQTMWQLKGAGNFIAAIDPVWSTVRKDGEDIASRNSRKTFDAFYDKYMERNKGGAATGRRQAFREYCADHGIVYSRMRVDKFASVASKDNFESMADKVWLSKDSKIELRQMTAGSLHVDRVNEEVENAGLYWFNTTQDSPFDYHQQVTDSILSTHTNWTKIDSDDKADGIVIDINAASLSNKYYLVRGEVEEDKVAGVADTTSIDTFNGPLLSTDDGSGSKTAEWYHDDDILFQVKIDKVQSKLKSTGRKPASN